MKNFINLPEEIQRKILLFNDESVLLKCIYLNKKIYSYNFYKLFIPYGLEYFYDFNNPNNNRDTRIKMHKDYIKTINECAKHNNITSRQFYLHELKDNISRIIGDNTKYDCPFTLLDDYLQTKNTRNWKIFGFLSYEHFINTIQHDNQMNYWRERKSNKIIFNILDNYYLTAIL